MRALIVADVHSNLEAFRSVILDAEGRGGFDQLWSVGDVVGYGPNPTECIALMQLYDARGIAGNHDLACAGKLIASECDLFLCEATYGTGVDLPLDGRGHVTLKEAGAKSGAPPSRGPTPGLRHYGDSRGVPSPAGGRLPRPRHPLTRGRRPGRRRPQGGRAAGRGARP